jgi:hypothetical protein
MKAPSNAILSQEELDRFQRIEAKLREVAGECGECGGTGLIETPHGTELDCEECADIREALAPVRP